MYRINWCKEVWRYYNQLINTCNLKKTTCNQLFTDLCNVNICYHIFRSINILTWSRVLLFQEKWYSGRPCNSTCPSSSSKDQAWLGKKPYSLGMNSELMQVRRNNSDLSWSLVINVSTREKYLLLSRKWSRCNHD